MKHLTIITAALALFSRTAADPVIIVMCGGNSDAIKQAKTMVEAAGGKIIYDYNALGGFAATYPSDFSALQANSLFDPKSGSCTLDKDRMVSIDKPRTAG